MITHTISILVENHSGALSRIAGLFSSRGYNISSLTVAETEDPSVSRMTIMVTGEEPILEQIVKQLNKLIDVIKVIDFDGLPIIRRELLLARVDTSKSTRHEIIELCGIFDARIVSVTPKSLTVELAGASESIDDFIALVKPFGIKEIVRSGPIAIGQARN
ncbi:MAG: acetolactate synthase small subunit [Candidatus Aminicenantales bacterium]|jgi:acetolactate synthase I/III small subunit